MTISLKAYEKLLKIVPSVNATIEDRRSAIRAKWRANGKNSMKLIIDVCNSWKNGEIEATFTGGKYQLRFVGAYGVPSDFNALISMLEEIKLAHIGYNILFKWLLIEDIHEVKTVEKMQQLTIDMFAFGSED